jgi:hypothetical protein
MAMRRFELDDLVNRPGTYFNPQLEVVVVVDDSPDLDSEIFNMEEFEGSEWVLVSEELPIDEHARDTLLEQFQTTHSPGKDAQMESEGTEEEDFDGFEVQDPDEEY